MATAIKRLIAFGLLPFVLFLYIAYLAAYEALKEVMPYVVYIGGAGLALIILVVSVGFAYLFVELVATRKTKLQSDRDIYRADAEKAQNEADKSKVLVITGKRGDQVIIRDNTESNYRQLHLNPSAYVNGHYETPDDLQLAIYNQYYQGRMLDSGETSLPPIDSPTILLERTDWIERVILPAPHIHYCGATRSGKTTLANHQIERINKQDNQAKFYLLNPKDTAARKPFIIEPDFKDITEALEGLETFNQVMLKRKNDPNLSKDIHKIVFVIDEWDWIYQTYGNEATRLLIPLIKVGAELNIKVILIGQSPLTGDTGLSQSLYHNTVRVAIWQEGGRLLANYQLDKQYKRPLLEKYEQLKSYAPEFKSQAGYDLRYCTVVPMAGNPTVEVIPYLTDPQPIKKGRSRPIPTEYEKELLLTWLDLRDKNNLTGTALYQKLKQTDTRPNGRDLENYRQVIRKFGEEPGF